VYANVHALPRAFVVGRQQVMRPGAHAPALLTEPTFDARRVVLTESLLPRLPRTDSKDLDKPGEARLLSYGDERVVVRAHALRVGLLVLNGGFDPGWKATVDGRDAEVHRVNYFMRGVLLSPGQHRIEFLYQPRSFRAGLILSLTSTAMFLATAAYGLLRRRRARL